ncbi:MAG: Clp protease ClpP [Lachnospiraceae bacterium]|nr:Clp protease ClpP [Lachnospiraceae bacterium]
MKFWKWKNAAEGERTLLLNGPIDEESWFGDEVTPALFRDDLNAGAGDITVWINSPGGDCNAAAQIYNMLRDYKGHVTVKIDGIAASAASVVAMAGDTVLMSPVSMMMIHNPSTIAIGNTGDMQKAIDMLDAVKESIINAYRLKSGLSRNRISQMMDDESWLDANKAVELRFADGVIGRDELYSGKAAPTQETEPKDAKAPAPKDEAKEPSMLFSSRKAAAEAERRLIDYCREQATGEHSANSTNAAEHTTGEAEKPPNGRKLSDLFGRLELMKQFI